MEDDFPSAGHHRHQHPRRNDDEEYTREEYPEQPPEFERQPPLGRSEYSDEYPQEPRPEFDRPPPFGRNVFTEGYTDERRNEFTEPEFGSAEPSFDPRHRRNEFSEPEFGSVEPSFEPPHRRNELSEAEFGSVDPSFMPPHRRNEFSQDYPEEHPPEFGSVEPDLDQRRSGYGSSDHGRPITGSTYYEEGYNGGGQGRERVQTVRVFTKAKENYSLTIRDGSVILAYADPNDESQHWIKDMKYSTRVKDEEGFPSFALVNKATGEALKHSIGATHPVQLVPYNPEYLDESVLWTESKDLGDGFRCIRMVNNISLNFDAFHGDEEHGGVRDGTTLVLWEWLEGNNQRWKIVPY